MSIISISYQNCYFVISGGLCFVEIEAGGGGTTRNLSSIFVPHILMKKVQFCFGRQLCSSIEKKKKNGSKQNFLLPLFHHNMKTISNTCTSILGNIQREMVKRN